MFNQQHYDRHALLALSGKFTHGWNNIW